MQSLIKTADQRSRAMYRAAASAPDPRFAKLSSPKAVGTDGAGVDSIDDSDVWTAADVANGDDTPDATIIRAGRGHSGHALPGVLASGNSTTTAISAAQQHA